MTTTYGSIQAEPIRIQINDEDDDSSMREIVTELSRKVGELTYWPGSECPVPFPDCKLLDRVNLVDLMHVELDQSEVEALSMENGQPRRLTDAQKQQIADDGTFSVASKLHPSHSHVWKVAKWLQKGRKATNETFQKGVGKALYHIVIGVPDRLVQSTFISVRRGLSSVKSAVLGIADVTVGVIDTVQKYSNEDIERKVRERENEYVLEQLEATEATEREENVENGAAELHVDSRLFDNELRCKLDPIVNVITGRATSCWNRDRAEMERMEIKAKLDTLDLESSEYRKRLEWELEYRMLETIKAELEKDTLLETHAPGYGASWGSLLHLRLIVRQVEEELACAVTNQRPITRQQIMREHPLRSLVDEWLEKQVELKLNDFRSESKWKFYAQVPGKAVEAGLGDVASVYEDFIIPFQKSDETLVRERFMNERSPASVMSFQRRIWKPANWHTERIGQHFVPIKYETEVVRSDKPFWRMNIIYHRTKSSFCNGLYGLFRWIWTGPIGIKSLFLSESFAYRHVMDTTGEVLLDEGCRRHTLRSRLKAIWDHVVKLRRDFEALPGTGFLGKTVERFLNRVNAYLGIGIPGTLLVAFGQPMVTALNLVISSTLILLSPLWALFASLFEYLFCLILFDFHETGVRTSFTGSWFVLIGHTIFGVIIQGLVRTTLALMFGVVVHPGLALLRLGFETVRMELRIAYDAVLRTILVRFGRVPGCDSFLAWRIAGPGITSKYCLHVKQDVALLAMAALLEMKEVELYELYARDVIKLPLQRYRQLFEPLSVFGVSISTSGMSVSFLEEARRDQTKHLKIQVQQARRRYQRAFDVSNALPEHASRTPMIKQNETDLRLTLRLATDMVESFYERMTVYPTDKLWVDADVSAGNFGGLAQHYFASIFGKGFLEPTEITDETIVIPIKADHLTDLLKKLYK